MTIARDTTYIDAGSGEIIGRKSTMLPNYFDPDKGYRMMARTKSLRVFPAVTFPTSLLRIDLGHLLYLSRAMWANTGVLGDIKGRSFVPFDDARLIAYVGFESRKGRQWLARMVGLSMLRSIDVNMPDGRRERQWHINPVYFCPMFITRQAYLIWRDQIEQLIPDYVRRIFNGEL